MLSMYPFRAFSEDGGLVSYGPNFNELFRQAAGYVDRILKGEKPGELPIQAPTKFNLIFNVKAAKAIGLEFAPLLLARRRGDRVGSTPRLDHLQQFHRRQRHVADAHVERR